MLIIYVVAFIAIFYFMAIRPQQKQRRAHAALLASLKKGDSVVTASGIYGKVKRVEESFVVIEVARGVNMKIARRAVAEIIRDRTQARAVAPEVTTGGKGKRARAELDEPAGDEFEEAGGEEIEAEAADAAESEPEEDPTKS